MAREALDLPMNKKIILTGSNFLEAKRKGWEYLKDALKKINSDNFLLLTYGENNDPNISLSPFPLKMMGYIHDHRLMRLLYSSADVFVLPTLADNLPNVLIESLACGTPCVAFDTASSNERIG